MIFLNLARASVGKKISDGGDSGTLDYRREGQGIFQAEMFEYVVLEVFGPVIGFGSAQVSMLFALTSD